MLAVANFYLSVGYTQASHDQHRIYSDDYIDEIPRYLKTNLGKIFSTTVTFQWEQEHVQVQHVRRRVMP